MYQMFLEPIQAQNRTKFVLHVTRPKQPFIKAKSWARMREKFLNYCYSQNLIPEEEASLFLDDMVKREKNRQADPYWYFEEHS